MGGEALMVQFPIITSKHAKTFANNRHVTRQWDIQLAKQNEYGACDYNTTITCGIQVVAELTGESRLPKNRKRTKEIFLMQPKQTSNKRKHISLKLSNLRIIS